MRDVRHCAWLSIRPRETSLCAAFLGKYIGNVAQSCLENLYIFLSCFGCRQVESRWKQPRYGGSGLCLLNDHSDGPLLSLSIINRSIGLGLARCSAPTGDVRRIEWPLSDRCQQYLQTNTHMFQHCPCSCWPGVYPVSSLCNGDPNTVRLTVAELQVMRPFLQCSV